MKVVIHLFYAIVILVGIAVFISYIKFNDEQTAICISNTSKEFNNHWTHLCKVNAAQEKKRLKNCVDEGEARNRLIYTSSEDLKNADKQNLSSCNNLYDDASPDPDCLLPKFLADSVNNDYQKSVDACKT